MYYLNWQDVDLEVLALACFSFRIPASEYSVN